MARKIILPTYDGEMYYYLSYDTCPILIKKKHRYIEYHIYPSSPVY